MGAVTCATGRVVFPLLTASSRPIGDGIPKKKNKKIPSYCFHSVKSLNQVRLSSPFPVPLAPPSFPYVFSITFLPFCPLSFLAPLGTEGQPHALPLSWLLLLNSSWDCGVQLYRELGLVGDSVSNGCVPLCTSCWEGGKHPGRRCREGESACHHCCCPCLSLLLQQGGRLWSSPCH